MTLSGRPEEGFLALNEQPAQGAWGASLVQRCRLKEEGPAIAAHNQLLQVGTVVRTCACQLTLPHGLSPHPTAQSTPPHQSHNGAELPPLQRRCSWRARPSQPGSCAG